MKEKELRLLTVVYPGPMAAIISDDIQWGTAARSGGHPEGNTRIKIRARCFRTGLLKLSKTAGSRCLRTGGLLLRFRSALEQLVAWIECVFGHPAFVQSASRQYHLRGS